MDNQIQSVKKPKLWLFRVCAGYLVSELTSIWQARKFAEDYGCLSSWSINMGNSRGSIVELG